MTLIVQNLPASVEKVVLIPRLGRSPGHGNSNPPECSCLESPMERAAWRDTVHGIEDSQA